MARLPLAAARYFFGAWHIFELLFPLRAWACSRLMNFEVSSIPQLLGIVSKIYFHINRCHFVLPFLVRPSGYPHFSIQVAVKFEPKFCRFCFFLSFLHLLKCFANFVSLADYGHDLFFSLPSDDIHG